jgi:hypothetical protein
MAVEHKLSPDHPASMAERINKRLNSSGVGADPDIHTQEGTGPTRTHHHIHHGFGGKQYGKGDKGQKGYQHTHASRSQHTLSEFGPDRSKG